MTTVQLPESNADNVAVNLVFDAIIKDVHKPGDAIADLLEKMAAMAREIGAESRVTNADRHSVVDEMKKDGIEQSEMLEMTRRHLTAGGDIWAREWMLCNMAKHLHHRLEVSCTEFPLAAAIETVEYESDGSVKCWHQRPESI